MAIVNNFSKFGVTFENAYHRINELNFKVEESLQPVVLVTGSEDAYGNEITPVYENQWTKIAYGGGEVETYASEGARLAHSESLSRTRFSLNYDLTSSETWIEQAYAHVKTLEQFSGSVDLL